jgi:hypothetical protein
MTLQQLMTDLRQRRHQAPGRAFFSPCVQFAIGLALVLNALSQSQSNAQLVDEFPRSNCEEILVRTGAFAQQLRQHPDEYGIVVVFGAEHMKPIADLNAELIYRTLLGNLGFDRRVSILRSESENALVIQFWTAKDNTDLGLPATTVFAKIPSNINKRFYFGAETFGSCSNRISHIFAKLVKSNPEYVGQIILYNVPRSKRANSAENWLQLFRTEYGVGRRQLRIFFKSQNNSLDPFISERTEFWILRRQ